MNKKKGGGVKMADSLVLWTQTRNFCLICDKVIHKVSSYRYFF